MIELLKALEYLLRFDADKICSMDEVDVNAYFRERDRLCKQLHGPAAEMLKHYEWVAKVEEAHERNEP